MGAQPADGAASVALELAEARLELIVRSRDAPPAAEALESDANVASRICVTTCSRHSTGPAEPGPRDQRERSLRAPSYPSTTGAPDEAVAPSEVYAPVRGVVCMSERSVCEELGVDRVVPAEG